MRPLARFVPARNAVALATMLAVLGACAASPGPEQPSAIAAVDQTLAPPTPVVTPLAAPSNQVPPTATPSFTPFLPTTPPVSTDDPHRPTGAPPQSSASPTTAPTGTPPTGQPTDDPPDPTLEPVETGNARPTRIVIAALGIDLPVIKSDPNYPYCNVAQYLTNFVNPGHAGSTYIYGHARTGMFLPLLTKSKVNDGASMIGMRVALDPADRKRHVYRINIVTRQARDFSLATDLRAGQHRLVLQTSEGPNYTYPKLQVAAKPIGIYKSTAAVALPTPHPKICH